MHESELASLVLDVPDFPKAGVTFKDMTPLLADPAALSLAVELMANPYRGLGVELVVGAESRGFIWDGDRPALSAGFVPVRKPGKLPREVHGMDYDLEYGTDRLEIHADAIGKGQKILLVDDVLATGGTMRAKCDLAEKIGAEIVGIAVLIELGFLHGRHKLGPHGESVHAVLKY